MLQAEHKTCHHATMHGGLVKKMCLAGQCRCGKNEREMCQWPPDAELGRNSPELQPTSSRGQLHCEPKFKDAFDTDHISKNDCQLPETKYPLYYFSIVIQPSWCKSVFSEENRKTPRNRMQWAHCAKQEHSFVTSVLSYFYFQLNHVLLRNTTLELDTSKQPVNVIPQTPVEIALWTTLELVLHCNSESNHREK